MHRVTFLCLLLILSALPHLQAAPAPKPTNAKPAEIKAGTEQNLQWVQQRLVSCAHIAILRDEKVAELAIVRRHVRNPKDGKDLVSWLEKNFRIERVKGKNLVRVSFQDGNAKEQAAIINVVVDDYLKNNVGSRRESLTTSLKSARGRLDQLIRSGKITAEEKAKAEEGFKKREEYIQTLPALVEHAKIP